MKVPHGEATRPTRTRPARALGTAVFTGLVVAAAAAASPAPAAEPTETATVQLDRPAYTLPNAAAVFRVSEVRVAGPDGEASVPVDGYTYTFAKSWGASTPCTLTPVDETAVQVVCTRAVQNLATKVVVKAFDKVSGDLYATGSERVVVTSTDTFAGVEGHAGRRVYAGLNRYDGSALPDAKLTLGVRWGHSNKVQMVGSAVTNRRGYAHWVLPRYARWGHLVVSYAGNKQNPPATTRVPIDIPTWTSTKVTGHSVEVHLFDAFGHGLGGVRAGLVTVSQPSNDPETGPLPTAPPKSWKKTNERGYVSFRASFSDNKRLAVFASSPRQHLVTESTRSFVIRG